MKILATILFTLLFSLSQFAQTIDVKTVVVTSQKANLRGTASVTGKVVIEVVQGQVFDVLLKQGEWFLVQTPMFVGWLHQSVITANSWQGYQRVTTPKVSPPDLDDLLFNPRKGNVETNPEPKYLSESEDNG